MAPTLCAYMAPVPPPSNHRTAATALHLDALTLVTRLELLALCRLAVRVAQRQCPPPLPAGPGGAPRIYTEESLLLLALLRTLWRLSYQELHDWLCAWPALACGLPPTWTALELGKRTSIERFFGRVLVFFRMQRPPVFGWSAVETRVALTYAAVWVIALAAWQAGRPDLIRSPRLVLTHVWEGVDL
jgi:hypothetical protein